MNGDLKVATATTPGAGIPPRYSELKGARKIPIALTCLSVVAVGLALYFFDPAGNSFYPYCWFYRHTGWLCPGCGALRASHQLLHGRVAVAFQDNAVFVSALPLLGLWAGRWAISRWRGQTASWNISPRWLWVAGAGLLVFGILRNLPFAGLSWLRP